MKREAGSADSCNIYKSELLHPKGLLMLSVSFYTEMCPRDYHSRLRPTGTQKVFPFQAASLATKTSTQWNLMMGETKVMQPFTLQRSLLDIKGPEIV